MLRVGLTGSIATGKTFVAGALAEFGCHVMDADLLARKVVEPGAPGLRAMVAEFGPWILREDGTLDRSKVGEAIFRDEEQRRILNALLHPLILAEQDAWLRSVEGEDPRGVAVVEAALMIESGGYRRFDKLIVVHCRPELQLERLMSRNRFSLEEAQSRIAAQMPQEEKLRYADYSIDTSTGFADTRAKTRTIYEELKTIAEREA